MSADDRLTQFIEQARQKGLDHLAILALLKTAGWRDRQIADAIAIREVGIPLPERTGLGSAANAFFHLVAFTALYTTVIALVRLCFLLLDFGIPDEVDPIGSMESEQVFVAMRWHVGAILIAYPLFLCDWAYLLRLIRATPEKSQSGVRRWLSYLSMFIGAATIMSYLIYVVYYFLNGELTLLFALKSMTLLAIAGTCMLYLWLLQRAESEVAT